LTFLAAALSAVIVTCVWRQFDKDEPPHALWRNFTAALWCWTVAEGLWLVYALVYEDIPKISMIDFFWVIAYGFFAAAYLWQYRLIYATKRTQEVRWLGFSALGVLLATLVGTILLRQLGGGSEETWPETLLSVFYPIGDLALALAAINLARIFGRGLWGRAWYGLLVLVISDAGYAVISFTGIYSSSVEKGNYWSLLIDTLYFDAYVLLALACLAQLLLLHYGPPQSKAAELDSEAGSIS
jgi:hypothetical protein